MDAFGNTGKKKDEVNNQENQVGIRLTCINTSFQKQQRHIYNIKGEQHEPRMIYLAKLTFKYKGHK